MILQILLRAIFLGHPKKYLIYKHNYVYAATWRGLQGDNPVIRPARTRRCCPQILSPSHSNPLFESYQISGDTPVVVAVRCVHVSCGFSKQGCLFVFIFIEFFYHSPEPNKIISIETSEYITFNQYVSEHIIKFLILQSLLKHLYPYDFQY